MGKDSSQSAELDSDHCDVDPSFGARLCGFVIAHEPSVEHQPAERPFYSPAAGQDFEALGMVGALDDLDGQLGAESLDPLRESRAGVAAIDPKQSQPGKPDQNTPQQQLSAVTLRDVGWSDFDENQAESVHQKMTFAAFDPLARVVSDASPVSGGFDGLAVQNGAGGAAAFAVGFAHQNTQVSLMTAQ